MGASAPSFACSFTSLVASSSGSFPSPSTARGILLRCTSQLFQDARQPSGTETQIEGRHRRKTQARSRAHKRRSKAATAAKHRPEPGLTNADRRPPPPPPGRKRHSRRASARASATGPIPARVQRMRPRGSGAPAGARARARAPPPGRAWSSYSRVSVQWCAVRDFGGCTVLLSRSKVENFKT